MSPTWFASRCAWASSTTTPEADSAVSTGIDGQHADDATRLRAAVTQAGADFRAPLNLITSLSQLMRRGETDAARLERLSAVEQAVHQLGSLVDGLMARTRSDGGAATALLRPLRPVALLDEVAVMLRPLAQLRGLSIQVDRFEGLPGAGFRGDAAHTRQALLYAGRWALAAGDVGALRFRVAPPSVAASPVSARIELLFTCRRPSFDPAQVVAHDVDWLSLRRQVTQQGGDCGLQALADDRWCCWFTVEWQLDADRPGGPAEPGAPAESGPGPDPGVVSLSRQLRQRHAGRRVLVVEDDKVNQMVMLELLGDVGLLADTAEDGQEALDRVAVRPYALVAMDLRMPRLDGLGATRALRAMPALASMPIVAVTANAFDEDRAACRAAGMNDFISKPIDVDRLYSVLLHWLDRSPLAPSPAPQPATSAVPVRDSTVRPPATAPAPPTQPGGVDAALAPLLGLDGLDAIGGLGSVGGRVATYRRLLGVFIDAHRDDGRALQQFINDGQAEAAGRMAHRLRGSAATLGMVDVEGAAAGLESAIDRGERGAGLARLADAVAASMSTIVPALRTALAG